MEDSFKEKSKKALIQLIEKIRERERRRRELKKKILEEEQKTVEDLD